MKIIRTPLQFAFFVATIILVLVLFLQIVYSELSDSNLDYFYFTILSVSIWLVCFAVVYFLLEKLITQKIRMLYRTIHNYKITKENFPISMNEDLLSAAEDEVLQWAESNREEITKLREQEIFRREFLGNLSHELKTPIFSIQGYILTLLEGGLEDVDVNREFLKRASKGVDRMTKIVEDLDVITKFESEKIKLDLKNFDVVQLAKEIMDELEIRASNGNIKLIFNKSYREPMMVMCDRDKIGQVFQNLIINAINYSEEGKEVEVRFYDIEENFLIEVSDQGLGIEEKHLARLFERFYRVDKSRARNKGGTGLGLAIVKHIVEAHNQSISVRSSIGKGSTFSFTLKKVK
ncbi:MAG: ATP-binding protein [Flavobacteriales bacterium]|nr:ATP-binding protein [Flavobacteriales bacterium]